MRGMFLFEKQCKAAAHKLWGQSAFKWQNFQKTMTWLSQIYTVFLLLFQKCVIIGSYAKHQ